MKPDNNEREEQGTPFNMAMLYYIRLNRLLDTKDQASLNENVWEWYKCLRAVYRNIRFKIKKPESLEKQFEKVKKALTSTVPGNSLLRNEAQSMIDRRAWTVLDEIDQELMIQMDKQRMIFPKITKLSGLDELEKRYGLNG